MLRPQSASAIFQRARFVVPAQHSTTAYYPNMTATEAPPMHQPPSSDRPASDEVLRQQKPPPPAAGGAWFPMGYKEAAYQWWSSATPSISQRRVIGLVPYLREATEAITKPADVADPASDPYGTRVWRSSLVRLSGKDRALNELSVERVGEETEETVVMVHGYGAGLGFFYKNFEPITRIPGLKLYALDMLGMGNSSRPHFKIHAKKREDQVVEAESWFIDALEEWRQARKIERFTLVGHSLGGYLAVSYALKYPGHLKKLILASPVGIPEDPWAEKLPESTLQNEFVQDQQSVTEGTADPRLAQPSSAAASPAATPKRPIPSWAVWLWEANVSPFSIVRLSGPFGPRVVSGWTSRRFNHLPTEEARVLHDYAFSIFKQKGSGEYALAYLLSPGAYARVPVINKVHRLGRGTYQGPDGQARKETGLPVVFMYGEHDWMDEKGGYAAVKKLKQVQDQILETATPEAKAAESGRARVVIIPNAGHHLYLDNADAFNRVLRKELEDVRDSEKKKKKLAAA
ncbi:abhydrolase domain-containing protein [Stachybotrys elegans]|uniref:Abhydrolase domain-containing protein n=1 Tax=Stachybotrys elegans TaxID=80388 RepID=A0A8K0T2P6_9HYPO|nr:abhydrolase domain-containing protein [Stachybotrys elegans]